MTRRRFFAACAVAPTALAQPPVVFGEKQETAFVTAFNYWTTVANQNGDIVDVKEIKAWHAAETAWGKLRSIVRQSYK